MPFDSIPGEGRMELLMTYARHRVGVTAVLALGIMMACGSSSPSGNDHTDGFPQCTGTQRCVGYPSFGDWVCLESCSGVDAGDCPSGMTCTSVSGCCTGTGCSATSANVCVALDAGAPGDAASDVPSDANGGDVDGGFPQCTGTQ